MTFHELIDDEIISHEILQLIFEQKIIIDGDEVAIQQRTDIIQIQQIMMKDSDHAQLDDIYLVDENGML